MKPWGRNLFALTIVAGFSSSGCSDAPEASNTSTSAQGSGVAACLLEAAQSPCQLLTLDRSRAALASIPKSAETHEDVSNYNSSCTVSWSGGRTMQVGSGDYAMQTEVDDSLALSNIRQVQPDVFARQHRTFSADEKANAAARAEAAVADKADDGSIDKKYEQVGKDFAKSLINKMQWDAVADIGDQAAWGGVGRFKTLNVLVDNAMFSIRANISDKESEVLDASKTAALAIIDACD